MENNFLHDEETINEFLLSMSDEILITNIEEQIKSNATMNENYFEFIIDKLDAILTVLEEDDYELKNKVNNFKDEICDKVQSLLQEQFNFNLDLKCFEDRCSVLKQLYTFFVMRKKERIENIVYNYIKKEYSSLLLTYSKNKINKKDITYINTSKEKRNNLVILLNIHNIIDGIQIPDNEAALELMISDKSEFTYNFILTMVDNFELEFNLDFISSLLKDLSKEKNNLIMNIRLKLMEELQ